MYYDESMADVNVGVKDMRRRRRKRRKKRMIALFAFLLGHPSQWAFISGSTGKSTKKAHAVRGIGAPPSQRHGPLEPLCYMFLHSLLWF